MGYVGATGVRVVRTPIFFAVADTNERAKKRLY
jgi:hypothetical protein